MDDDSLPLKPPDRRGGPFEAWRGGFTLADALDRFADGARWSDRRSRVMERFDRLRTDPRSPLADRVEATVRLQDMARAWEEQARLLEELRAYLVEQLHAGALLAVGFTVETAPTSKLTTVPREAWTNATAIDWDRSDIQGKDMAFLDVRVLPHPQDLLKDDNRSAAHLTANRP